MCYNINMKCSVDNCDSASKSRGFCIPHYGKWYKHGSPLISKKMKNKGLRCYAVECEDGAVAKGLCSKHHQRLMIHGDPDIIRRGGLNDTKWKGGKTTTRYGYVYLWIDKNDPLYVMTKSGKNYALQHRIVMARSLGRPLTKKETVRHINGIRSDNRLENLQLRNGSHGQGVVLQCLDCSSTNISAVEM